MIITNTHVYFYNGPFSNWHRQRKLITDPLNNNITFDTSEAAFMWWKAVFFQDHKIASLLEQVSEPGHCKALGRQIQGYDDAAWTCVRLGYMNYVNLLKYRQNAALKELLLSTGDRILVEASPEDKIWGVGLGEEDPLISDEKNWRGLNLLGQSLMTVRGLIK